MIPVSVSSSIGTSSRSTATSAERAQSNTGLRRFWEGVGKGSGRRFDSGEHRDHTDHRVDRGGISTRLDAWRARLPGRFPWCRAARRCPDRARPMRTGRRRGRCRTPSRLSVLRTIQVHPASPRMVRCTFAPVGASTSRSAFGNASMKVSKTGESAQRSFSSGRPAASRICCW